MIKNLLDKFYYVAKTHIFTLNAHTSKLDSVACAIYLTVQLAVQILGRRSCAVQFVQYRQYPPYTLHSYLHKPNCAGHIVQFYCPCVIGL